MSLEVKLKDFMRSRLPDVPRELLPARAKLLGEVALLRLRPELEDRRYELGKLVKEFYRVKAVYLIRGVEGVERRPVLELLAGEPVEEIVHREYGCVFKLDLTKLMFCLGNSFERLRIAALTSSREIVLDMFAGVGQFTIPLAVLSSPKRIYAIEINPEAYHYLLENIELNHVKHKVSAILGDCRKIVLEKLRGTADRVVMGYFGGTINALPAALSGLKPEGGVIHFHELARRGFEEELVEDVLRRAREQGFRARLIGWRKVKSYSRTRNHVVIDFLAARA